MPGAGSRDPFDFAQGRPGAGDWQQSPRKRAEVATIATVGYPLMRALSSTWRWKVSGGEHFDAITAQGRQPILALWHGRIFTSTVYFQRRGVVAITEFPGSATPPSRCAFTRSSASYTYGSSGR